MTEDKKRKAEEHGAAPPSKRTEGKNKRKWQVPRKAATSTTKATIKFGDAGIWVTCVKGKEGKCSVEMADLLDEYSGQLESHEESSVGETRGEHGDDASETDVEANIATEIQGMKQGSRKLIEPVKIDTACVTFIKVRPPLDPTAIVHRICDDARQDRVRQRSRFIQRLTPVAFTAKADEAGLDQVARKVLAPYFHQQGQKAYKYAIRPTVRSHTVLARDNIIDQVAAVVGAPHTVDLKHYDFLILVEIWKNVCGMAVVRDDYEDLKRYNLLEIYRTVSATTKIDT